MAWDAEVPGCFGAQDKLFAIHPLDEHRAFLWLTSLREREATHDDADRQVQAYHASEGCGEEHIEEQIDRLLIRFGPWLPS